MDDAPKWDVKECDCEEVGGSCLLGHDEILRLRAALDKAEGERDDVTQGLLDMLRRAHLAEGENAILRELLWLRHGCNISALYGDDGEMQCGMCLVDFKRLPAAMISELWTRAGLAALASPTQPAPAGEVPKCRFDTDGDGNCPLHPEGCPA